MKAISLSNFGGADFFQAVDFPLVEPQPDEVRIRLSAASFNPIDVYIRCGRLGGDLPMILGRDLSGTVEAVGVGVSRLRAGDEVYAYLPGRRSNGSYAEYVTAPADFVALKPANLSHMEAAAIPVVGLTALHCVAGKARITAGQSAFVAGAAGGVGTMTVNLLKHYGAEPIIATAGNVESANYLITLGIKLENIIFYRDKSVEELTAAVVEVNDGKKVEAAFDFVGGAMKRLCFEAVGVNGQVVSIVEEPADFSLNLWDENTSPMVLKAVSFHFEQLGANALQGKNTGVYYRELDELKKLLESGQLPAPQISDVGDLSLETVRQAHLKLEESHSKGKMVMKIR
jgi:NADPH:quinone reductase-like Zn-dependent oxidoreductase